VANKVDHAGREPDAAEFIRLGLGEPHPISASNGIGTGDLLSKMVAGLGLRSGDRPPEDAAAVLLAVVGRPNVGKSTLVNTLVGRERLLVTEIPGTTRDSVDVRVTDGARGFVLVDTAGLRRKTHVASGVEYYSTLRAHAALERCDIACVVADAAEGFTQQDAGILREAIGLRKGVLVAMNKTDLLKGDAERSGRAEESLGLRLEGLAFVPVLDVSAKTGFRVRRVLDTAWAVAEERRKRIPSPALNRFLVALDREVQPPAVLGRRVHILYGAQVGTDPPKFALFANYPNLIKPSYQKFIENRLRGEFGFQGVPLTFAYKKK
jgi:GTP-binding protein